MKIVREHINEKFQEHSDPIKDMGIGVIPEKIAKKFIEDTHGNVDFIAQKYFGNRKQSGLSYVLFGFFRKLLTLDITTQDAFYHACEDENFYGHREDIVKERELIAKVIQTHFNIDVDPNDPRL